MELREEKFLKKEDEWTVTEQSAEKRERNSRALRRYPLYAAESDQNM